MDLTREQVHLLIRHEYLLGSSGLEAVERINRAWGGGTVGKSAVYEWFRRFRDGEECVEEKARSGRPIEVDRAAVYIAIEEQPTLTSRMLAEDFGCGHTTIIRALHELGKAWRRTRWIPKELTDAQKAKRVTAARSLLDRQRRAPFLDHLITGDEKWISFNNPCQHHEWRSPGQKASAVPMKDFRQKKAMLCVFWSSRGVVMWELLEEQTVNSDVYCSQLERVNLALGSHSPIIFLDDNARPHRSHRTNALIANLGWERLDHPPYSPDLAPSDFHLFRSMQHFMAGKTLNNIEEMRIALQEFFSSKDPEFYCRGIMRLIERWEEVIEEKGDYCE